MEEQAHEAKSYVSFERTARGVIVPKVKVVSGDADTGVLDNILDQSRRLFASALEYAEENGSKP